MATVPESAESTVVAVAKDKTNCKHAVRWAMDHLVLRNPILTLLHVTHKSPNQSSFDREDLFARFRGFCNRNGVHVEEVVVEDTDTARALLVYINSNSVSNIVVGASNRNAFARKFKNYDVPTIIMKYAPEFCSVYVISKGKVMQIRPALKLSGGKSIPPAKPINNQIKLDHGDRGSSLKIGDRDVMLDHMGSEKSVDVLKLPMRDRIKSSSLNLGEDVCSAGIWPGIKTPNHSDGSSLTPASLGSVDPPSSSKSEMGSEKSVDVLKLPMRDRIKSSSLNLSEDVCSAGIWPGIKKPNHSDGSSLARASLGSVDPPSSSKKELEAEMKRLKNELKQTMDMYSSACKEAISAKQTAKELDIWKMEEARRIEEAKNAQDAACAIADKEKARCQAAVEAAEAAQKLAKKEAEKRREAELKAKRVLDEKNQAIISLGQNDFRYRKYTIEELEQATHKFSESMKIGEGGYGPVYKGKLDYTRVAIKVLRPGAAQGRKQFQQEVEVLSTIRHPNMVLLLGACPEYGCLVYEYMEKGSLEDCLLRRGNSRPLSWRSRFKIAAEIATALLFLHETKPEPLVHRDLKPANILIDRHYVSKISDVGLSRLVPASVADSVTQYYMTSAAGTFCYIDPEYQKTGKLTTKSDVYSLGIMLLQIITARPAMGIAHHVDRAISEGKFKEMIDPAVTDCRMEEALAFAKLAIRCAELSKKDRPDLGTVVVPELNRLRDLACSRINPLQSL